MPSAYDFTSMRRYSPFLSAMMDSTIDFTFGCVAGPDTLMRRVRLLAAGSACSEIIEKGCVLERVGAGASLQAVSDKRQSAIVEVLSIQHPGKIVRRTIVLSRQARVNLCVPGARVAGDHVRAGPDFISM